MDLIIKSLFTVQSFLHLPAREVYAIQDAQSSMHRFLSVVAIGVGVAAIFKTVSTIWAS